MLFNKVAILFPLESESFIVIHVAVLLQATGNLKLPFPGFAKGDAVVES